MSLDENAGGGAGGSGPPGGGGGGGGGGGDGGDERRRRRRRRGGRGGEGRREGAPGSTPPVSDASAPRPEGPRPPRPEGPRPPRPEGPRPEGQQRRDDRAPRRDDRGPRPEGQQARRDERGPRRDRPDRRDPSRRDQPQAQSRDRERDRPRERERERIPDRGRGGSAAETAAAGGIAAAVAVEPALADDEIPARLSGAPSRESSPTTAERWGDDSDAPTPDIRLAPDLPVEDADPDGERVTGEERPFDQGQLVALTGVKFQSAGKIYDMDAGDGAYARGDLVIVETDRGAQLATVAIPTVRRVVRGELRRILRRADARDAASGERNKKRADEALRVAKERARSRRLPIKMFKVDITQGGGKGVFYFSSEERVDFRDLVRDLSHALHLRVELRQIGARDEAKLVGGIGSCGRELCCTTFLPRFDPVSIKMAKDQGLVLNPSKVSGQCGRLKCCLVYEEATYRELRKGLPKTGKRVETPAGVGRVVEVDVLRQRIRVSFEDGDYQTFPADTVATISLPQPGASSSMPAIKSLPVVKDMPADDSPPPGDDEPDGESGPESL